MSQTPKSGEIRVDFDGLIHILADSLYSEPAVFIRELVQNANDAIVIRQSEEPSVVGVIDISLNETLSTISVRDNGVGMDESDIEKFFAVIGASSKPEVRSRLKSEGRDAANELIGQFGIGMLSAFLVANKVVVRTRKTSAPSGLAWHNDGSLQYQLYEEEISTPGTEVTLAIRPESRFVLNQKWIRSALVKYCDFVQFPISLNGRGVVNTMTAPWQRDRWTSTAEKERAYFEFVNRRFEAFALDVIPVEIDTSVRAGGVLFIPERADTLPGTSGAIDIYVRRMFITSADRSLLPPWASFVTGLIDSPALRPNAARDNIRRDVAEFTELQEQLGALILKRLIHLADTAPERFAQINRLHFMNLKMAALQFDEFFLSVGHLFLFETNHGQMSLQQYLDQHALQNESDERLRIYYFALQGAAVQFYEMAEAKNWTVINAGGAFDVELLKKYEAEHKSRVKLERVDASDTTDLFHSLSNLELQEFNELTDDIEQQLRRDGLHNIALRMRKFLPASLPAVIIQHPETEAEERLRDMTERLALLGSLKDVAAEAQRRGRQRPVYLNLNADNDLVRKLAKAWKVSSDQSRGEQSAALRTVFTGLHSSAMLYSHNLLTQENAKIIHTQMLRLLSGVVDLQTQERELLQALDLAKSQLAPMQFSPEKPSKRAAGDRHVLLFMITPFSEAYKALEEAVRNIFERGPYYFEVRLARDFTHVPSLLENVRMHMSDADAFLAEISDLNPNVMLELGAVLFQDDRRPVIPIRHQAAVGQIPADIRDRLLVYYGHPNNNPKEIEGALRSELEANGRPKRADLQELLQKRGRRFLSATLLANLDDVKLRDSEMRSLLSRFSSLEELLGATSEELSRLTDIPVHKCVNLQGELSEERFSTDTRG